MLFRSMSSTISASAFAKKLGVSRSAVSQMISAGRISTRSYVQNNRGHYHIDPVLAMEDLQKGTDTEHVDTPIKESAAVEDKVSATASLTEMRRNKMAVAIKREILSLQVAQGKLVEKEKVYAVLYDFGQSIRQTFQVIPNKIVDDVMAARTRNEAHKIIADSIDAALSDLVRIGELNFTKR